MAQSTIKPLHSLKITARQIPAHGLIPNTSIQRKPLIHYHGAFTPSSTSSDIERHLVSVGGVTPQWRYTMYSTMHFHSTTHEVLAVASGAAMCCFGGEENEGRYEAVLEEGDVVVVPAGVGHRLLEERKRPFVMVGSYPRGFEWDMCHGTDGEEEKIEGIKSLAWFDADPVYGKEGPALNV